MKYQAIVLYKKLSYNNKMNNANYPILTSPIKSFAVKQGEAVHRDLGGHFSPQDGSLEFTLMNAPSWLQISKKSGVLVGAAPAVLHAGQCLVTVRVENAAGWATESFFIDIISSNFFEDITRPLLNLNLWMPKDEFALQVRTTHEILRYIFEYFRQTKEWEILTGLLQEEASRLNINVSNKINYQDFRKIMLAMNPQMESELRRLSAGEHLLLEAKLTDDEAQQLFLQGVPTQNIDIRLIYRYLGGPTLTDIRLIKPVLQTGVKAITNLYQQAPENTLQQSPHIPRLTLNPKNWNKE